MPAQPIKVVKWSDVEKTLNQHSDTVTVINFWATWCKPCVEELPSFIQLEEKLKNQAIRFFFISLNFKSELNRVKNYLNKQPLPGTVWLLDEPDYNSWINKVDSSWGGSLPATVIVSSQGRSFIEKELSYIELQNLILPFIH